MVTAGTEKRRFCLPHKGCCHRDTLNAPGMKAFTGLDVMKMLPAGCTERERIEKLVVKPQQQSGRQSNAHKNQ
jgi:hypothetical protein